MLGINIKYIVCIKWDQFFSVPEGISYFDHYYIAKWAMARVDRVPVSSSKETVKLSPLIIFKSLKTLLSSNKNSENQAIIKVYETWLWDNVCKKSPNHRVRASIMVNHHHKFLRSCFSTLTEQSYIDWPLPSSVKF